VRDQLGGELGETWERKVDGGWKSPKSESTSALLGRIHLDCRGDVKKEAESPGYFGRVLKRSTMSGFIVLAREPQEGEAT